MSNRIDRAAFMRLWDGAELQLDQLSDAAWQRLEAAGLTRAQLEQLAGPDRVIRHRHELDQLFDLIDSFDHDGSRHSVRLVNPGSPASAAITPAGEIIDVLTTERVAPRSVTLRELTATFEQGVLDLGLLSPDARAELETLGFDVPALERLGSRTRCIRGTRNLQQLFLLLDRLDRDGSSYSLEATRALRGDAVPTPDDLTPAGRALAVLQRIFRPYEQQFHSYDDLSRARIEPPPPRRPIALDVPHRAQPDALACFVTSVEMVRRFNSALSRKLEGPMQSHYMAQLERDDGAIAGWQRDFEVGLRYIDLCLEQSRPVLVGVSHSFRQINYDDMTDHFIVITGRGVDEAGRLYYTYNDPATAGRFKTGRLYVDASSSLLFRPPFADASGGLFARSYQVTQVRPYADLPLESAASDALSSSG